MRRGTNRIDRDATRLIEGSCNGRIPRGVHPRRNLVFTVNLVERHGRPLLVDSIDLLHRVFRDVKDRHPFAIDASVALPEHMHCIWTLPAGDSAYKTRWALIKAGFSRQLPSGERRSASRVPRGERGIWQRLFWDHAISDRDFERHVDYIHWNSVKHGWVKRAGEWPHSSSYAYVRRGLYSDDWACDLDGAIDAGE
jgi:putative transposase